MAYLAIEINSGNRTITDFNQRVLNAGATNPEVVMNALIKLCSELQMGTTTGTVQLTSKSTTSTITTNGTGSTQITLTLS